VDLETIKPGSRVYFIDTSEGPDKGPGVVIYVQGTVVASEGTSVTLAVTNSGTLIAPGYVAPYEPDYGEGDVLKVEADRYHTFLSPKEFSELKESYEVIPEAVEKPDRPQYDEKEVTEPSESEAEERMRKRLAEEAEAEKERAQEKEEAAEGIDFDEEDDGLYLQADLKSWSHSAGITWPKGFPQPWMDQVYDDLPEGVSESSGGEPVVNIPEGKGLIPPDLDKTERLEKAFEEAGETLQRASHEFDEARDKWDEAEANKAEDVKSFRVIKNKKLEALEDAKRKYLKLKEHLQNAWLGRGIGEDLPKNQQGKSFEQGPKRRGPTEGGSFGRAYLRQQLKNLSDQYKDTEKLASDYEHMEDTSRQTRRELKLMLNLRKKKFEGKSIVPNTRVPEKPKTVLRQLKNFKYHELKDKPFLWNRKQRDEVTREANSSDAGFAAQFKKKVGGERTFFDLTPEEVNHYMTMAVETSGPMDKAEVDRRAKEYAEDFAKLTNQRMLWRDLPTEITNYISDKYNIAISKERADRLSKEIFDRSIKQTEAKGYDNDSGEIASKTLPTLELIGNVVRKITSEFDKRVRWLKFLQDNREEMLLQEKKKLRRALVTKDDNSEKIIDDQQYKEAIIKRFSEAAKRSNKSDTAEKIPSRYRVEHGLPMYKEKKQDLAKIVEQENALKKKKEELQQQLQAASAPYIEADEALKLKLEDIGLPQGATLYNNIDTQIKDLVKKREVLRNFFKGRADWEKGVDDAASKIEKSIANLQAELDKVILGYTPEEQNKLKKHVNIMHDARQQYNKMARAIEAQMDAVRTELDKVYDRKGEIIEEIGLEHA
jgi:DNA repair exonuclease SbcCD ATPase subunit